MIASNNLKRSLYTKEMIDSLDPKTPYFIVDIKKKFCNDIDFYVYIMKRAPSNN